MATTVFRACPLILFVLLTLQNTFAQQEQPEEYAVDTETVAYTDTLEPLISSRDIDPVAERDYQLRKVPDSVAERFKNDKEFEYANNPAFWKKEPPPDNSGLAKFLNWLSKSALMKWLLYIFLAAIIIIAVYKIMVVNDFFVFTGRKKKKEAETTDAEDLSGIDFDKKIAAFIEHGEYRQAVRFLYLKTLKLLSDKQQLQLDMKFTNQDYVRQMRKKSGGADFSRLTQFYEYAWYGDYPLTPQQFDHVHQNFNRFIHQS